MQSKGTSLTGDTPSALDQLQQQASKTLNSAVDQGKHDVGAAKSTVSGDYVDKARDMASSAISTAQVNQSYVPDFGTSPLTFCCSRISQKASVDTRMAQTARMATMSFRRSSLALRLLWKRRKNICLLHKKP